MTCRERWLICALGGAITNFERTLPPEQSDLRSSILKDPYCFDCLTIDNAAKEAELERGLVTHMRDFLMELGVGFALSELEAGQNREE